LLVTDTGYEVLTLRRNEQEFGSPESG